MANRRFVNRLQLNFGRKNDVEQQIISQRRFTRASQNPLDAARALRNRKTMSEAETYKANLDTATGIYDVAESNVRQISAVLQRLHEMLIRGANDTYTQEQRDIIATEVDQLAQQMVSLMNVTVAGRQIFGGVNNGVEQNDAHNGVAFRIDLVNRTVLYNGVDVNAHRDHRDFPDSRVSYLDVGLGMRWLDEHTIDPQTAIPVTFNGAQVMGSGTSVTNRWTSCGTKYEGFEHSNNLIQLTLDAATALRETESRTGGSALIALFADLTFEAQSFVSQSIARIGSEQSFIEFNKDRLMNLDYSLRERQNNLEFIDMGEATTRWKMLEMVYNATLQMSASTVPMSIFSFIR
jgi:flagellar hook-associated protein 3 FlgL